jgi:hypothetical protein
MCNALLIELVIANKQMKTLIVTTLFLLNLIIHLACTKERDYALSESIAGRWKYLYKSGGFSGNDTIYPKANATIILSLNVDNTYTTTENGQITQQGIYKLITLQSMFTNSPQPAIQFDYFLPNTGLLIELSESNLTFVDNHYEPFGSSYKRIQ